MRTVIVARCPTVDVLPCAVRALRVWPWTEDSIQLPNEMEDGSAWPRISITTPSYNQARFLEETIRSVLLQGYPNLEYIIIDGGSTDGTVDIIRKYSPWLKYWISEPDRGQSHAINKGWEKAEGDLIAYLNSDDTYLKDALGIVAKAFLGASNAAAVVGGVATIDQGSNILKGSNFPVLPINTPGDLTVLDPEKWRLPQQSGFFVKEVLNKVGCYVREELDYTMDRELYYRLAAAGQIVLVETDIATFRRHESSKSVTEIEKMYKEDRVAIAYFESNGLVEKLKRWRVGRWWVAKGYMKLVKAETVSKSARVRHLLFALLYRPSMVFWRVFWVETSKSLGVFGVLHKIYRIAR